MPLHLVTGISGSGKSTVVQALRARGVRAVSADEDGISRWVLASTGELAQRPEPAGRTGDWLSRHRWVMLRSALEELQAGSTGVDVFVGGSAANEADVGDLFSTVFALHADEATITHRLATRSDNDFGRTPVELDAVLQHHRVALETYARLGYRVLDATRPIERVVDELLQRVEART